MPYVMHACRACDALITDGVDPMEHGPEDERCYGDKRGPEQVDLFTVREMRERSVLLRLEDWLDAGQIDMEHPGHRRWVNSIGHYADGWQVDLVCEPHPGPIEGAYADDLAGAFAAALDAVPGALKENNDA